MLDDDIVIVVVYDVIDEVDDDEVLTKLVDVELNDVIDDVELLIYDEDEVVVDDIREIELVQHPLIEPDDDSDCVRILLDNIVVLLDDDDDDDVILVELDAIDEVIEVVVDLLMHIDAQLQLVEVDDDEVFEVICDEIERDEYLYWDTQRPVDIIRLDDVSMNVIDIVFIALQVVEL